MSSRECVGVIGLGLLGSALAERLVRAGYKVHVYNRSRDKSAPLIEQGAIWSDNPLMECDRTVICLYTTDTVEAVLDQLRDGWRPGLALVDTTTGSPDKTLALGAKLKAEGIQYLEAPVAASSEQTRNGKATVIVGGESPAVERCQDLLDAIAQKWFHVGPCGAAAKMKLVNNLILGLNRVAMAEGLVFAEAIGLDPAAALGFVKEGTAYSVAMDTKGEKMLARDFSVQAKLTQHLKDISLVLDSAASEGLELPFTTLHKRTLERLEEMGYGEQDNSAIIQAFGRAT